MLFPQQILIMPISSYLVNKLFAIEAIFQIAARHCGLPTTAKVAFARLNGQTLWFPSFVFSARQGA
jgi:hypothetical protein